MRKKDIPQFAIRIPGIKLDKMKYIAEYNGRSANKEFEILATRHIEEFEKEHGTIKIDMEDHQ